MLDVVYGLILGDFSKGSADMSNKRFVRVMRNVSFSGARNLSIY